MCYIYTISYQVTNFLMSHHNVQFFDFFCGGRGLNPETCIFYAFVHTKLWSRGPIFLI